MKIAAFQQIIRDNIGTSLTQIDITLRVPLGYQSNTLYDARAGQQHWIIKEYLKPEEFDVAPHREQEDLVSHEQWQAMIEQYHHAIGPEDPDLRQRIHLHQAIFPIFWLTILLNAGIKRTQQGKLAGWNANGLPAPIRLRRCLARGLAWPKHDFMDELRSLENLPFFPNG